MSRGECSRRPSACAGRLTWTFLRLTESRKLKTESRVSFSTGPPRSGKTTIIQKVAAAFPGRAAGFYTREVRQQGMRVGFEIVTLDGQSAVLSHVDFPGPYRVGKYGVNLENLHRVGLPALEAGPGVDLVVVDEVGKMECLSPRFIEAMERLWALDGAPVGHRGGEGWRLYGSPQAKTGQGHDHCHSG